MAPPRSRFNSAIQAMKGIGIPPETVKPVLRKLLELYDDNWALIEEESYRALADAIFEQQDSQKDDKNKEENDNERETENVRYEHELPWTRSRLRIVEPPSSPPSSSLFSCRESLSPLEGPELEEPPPLRRRSQSRLEEPPSSPSRFSPAKLTYDEASPSKGPALEEEPLKRQSLLRSEEPTSSLSWPSPPKLTYHEASSFKRLALEEEPLKTRSRLRLEEPCGSPAALPSLPYVAASSFKRPSSESAVSPHSPKKPVRAADSDSLKRPKTEPPNIEPFPISSIKDPLGSSFTPNANRVLHDSGHATSHCPQRPSVDQPIHDGSGPVQHSNPQNLRMLKLEPFVDDYPMVGVDIPGAVIYPSSPEKAECVNRMADSLQALSTMSRHLDDDEDENDRSSAVPNNEKELLIDSAPADNLSYEIASTSLGEVKLAISCDCSHTNQNFCVPSLDVVMKLVEDRAFKSYEILGSSFSIMKLMKEICQCYLELATNAGEQQERITVLTQKINMPKKDHILSAKCASFDLHSSLQRTLPQIPQHIALKCVHSLHRKKKVDQRNIKIGNVEAEETKPVELRSSTEIVLAQENHGSFNVEKPLHDVNDISKGEEEVQIPVINEVSSEPYPPSFQYIPNNIVYRNAYVRISLARIGDEDSCPGCVGDCVTESIPCSCAQKMGGEYAYSLDGLVKKEFLDEAISICRGTDKFQQFFCRECPLEKLKPDTSCKGHLVRRFIKECWIKCGCSKQCGNRVVQRGITINLQVFFTPEGKGWGLRTLEALPRGAFVCEYVGEILTNTELYSQNSQHSGDEKEKRHCPVLLDADWGSQGILKDEEALCLDATHYGNVARFINHRCFDANLVEIPVEIETPDHHYYHLALFTTRDVEALEELTWDYGIDFDDADHPMKALQCLCGSQACRKPKHPNRARSHALTIKGR